MYTHIQTHTHIRYQPTAAAVDRNIAQLLNVSGTGYVCSRPRESSKLPAGEKFPRKNYSRRGIVSVCR